MQVRASLLVFACMLLLATGALAVPPIIVAGKPGRQGEQCPCPLGPCLSLLCHRLSSIPACRVTQRCFSAAGLPCHMASVWRALDRLEDHVQGADPHQPAGRESTHTDSLLVLLCVCCASSGTPRPGELSNGGGYQSTHIKLCCRVQTVSSRAIARLDTSYISI
jgi:hypothetical protein